MQNNMCSCGCTAKFVKGNHVEQCKVCRLEFYSGCMFVKDRGFCKICALAPDTKTPGRNIHTLHAYISSNHLTHTLYTYFKSGGLDFGNANLNQQVQNDSSDDGSPRNPKRRRIRKIESESEEDN